ncbi:MAG: TetR family transcriptional regulator, partial [Solobacterium sp.]|nr:TetR family transcriptional regulator [Solobacterium sp.]
MPRSVLFRKEEIVQAALSVARRKGIDAVTARETARELGVSVG